MVFTKHTSLRCISNKYFIRSFLLFCPLIAFYLLLITCLKYSRSDGQNNPNHTQFKEFRQVDQMQDFYTFPENFSRFPVVKEFTLNSNIKKFDNEQARVIGFPITNHSTATENNMPLKVIYLATAYFGEWNAKHYYALHLGNVSFYRYNCPVSRCHVTKSPSDISRADAVLFHVRDLEIFSFPEFRSPQQIYIIYSMEPSWLEILDMRRFNGVFNWTMSYRGGSDVLMKYGFIGEKYPKNTTYKGNLSKPNFKHKQNKAVWYVSNCQTDSNREEYVKHLMKVYPIDVIGGCGKEGCRPAETKKCYTEIAKNYKFYLAFENALCKDYVTEKLFNPLEHYIIPVTFGGANYSKIAPENSVVNAMEFSTPEELGQHLWKISQNETLYLSYFEWKNTYRSYLQPWTCDLCKKLHEPITFKTNNDLESWWNEERSCMRWSAEGFKPIKKHEFPKFHTKVFL